MLNSPLRSEHLLHRLIRDHTITSKVGECGTGTLAGDFAYLGSSSRPTLQRQHDRSTANWNSD